MDNSKHIVSEHRPFHPSLFCVEITELAVLRAYVSEQPNNKAKPQGFRPQLIGTPGEKGSCLVRTCPQRAAQCSRALLRLLTGRGCLLTVLLGRVLPWIGIQTADLHFWHKGGNIGVGGGVPFWVYLEAGAERVSWWIWCVQWETELSERSLD